MESDVVKWPPLVLLTSGHLSFFTPREYQIFPHDVIPAGMPGRLVQPALRILPLLQHLAIERNPAGYSTLQGLRYRKYSVAVSTGQTNSNASIGMRGLLHVIWSMHLQLYCS